MEDILVKIRMGATRIWMVFSALLEEGGQSTYMKFWTENK